MKLFKPFVNLTKSKNTGLYTLNAVVSLPKDYALSSIEQDLIEVGGVKKWNVTASVMTYGSVETDIVEFSVPLKQQPTKEIKTVSMSIVGPNTEKANPENENNTDIGFDDAESEV